MVKSEKICQYLDTQQYKYTYGGTPINVERFCSLQKPKLNAITWIKKGNIVEVSDIKEAVDMLFIADYDDDYLFAEEHHVILCNNPKEIYFSILREFFAEQRQKMIESDSIICTERIGRNVSIGHHCYIGNDVTIGDNVTIRNNVSIECPTMIGENTVINSGVVIGTDGFGYYKKHDTIYEKVPHFGGVIIGKNVEIGANTCIDRGTLDDTWIGDNVKIDNLCHIAHNTEIGSNSLVVALSLLGGSSKLKENVYVAPGAIIRNQLTVEKNAIIGMGAVVTKDVAENLTVAGVPAKKIKFSGKL